MSFLKRHQLDAALTVCKQYELTEMAIRIVLNDLTHEARKGPIDAEALTHELCKKYGQKD